jgi:hypothetical protein
MFGRLSVAKAARIGLMAGGALALAGLGACGAQFDNSMSASFDKSMHDSCVSTATGQGAPAATAEQYCSCVVTQLDKVPIQQRVSLSPTSQPVSDAMTTCKTQVAGAMAPTAPTNDAAGPAAPTGDTSTAPASNAGE